MTLNEQEILAALREANDKLEQVLRSAQALADRTVEAPPDRKVWVVHVLEGDEYKVGPVQVMIEQFGDGIPTIAFRRHSSHVWSRPYRGEAAP